ncbi:Myb-like DNA-binding domain protein [Apophysomyces sp. BC1034]|nr:Myb-like DNA-binding domain protein [Apophysomyces sp. BC1015]KAG0177556.1 Myb-like DNA-binding domain protein [Apophysomyces sp. BC1021]KAG0192039.1 Myb-like DNA-binding domain protein [Apophysomyces sp. BC1034]
MISNQLIQPIPSLRSTQQQQNQWDLDETAEWQSPPGFMDHQMVTSPGPDSSYFDAVNFFSAPPTPTGGFSASSSDSLLPLDASPLMLSHPKMSASKSASHINMTFDHSPASPTPRSTLMTRRQSAGPVTTSRSYTVRHNRKSSSYSRWTEEEDQLLKQAVAVYGPHKWSLISSHVPNRTPMQCSTRWLGALNPHILKGRWTEQEDAILKFAVMEYSGIPDGEGGFQPIPWNKIAERIPNRTGIQCQARWTEALDPSVRKGKWNDEEDILLRAGVAQFGRCWIRIAETIPGRTQRQCRTRWTQIKHKEEKQRRKQQADQCRSISTASSVDGEESSAASSTTTEDDHSLDLFDPLSVSMPVNIAPNPSYAIDNNAPFTQQQNHYGQSSASYMMIPQVTPFNFYPQFQ